MKKLFIYFSYTGNGDIVAEEYKKLGYEIRKVELKKRLPKSFFWLIMTGGFLAGIGAKPKLKEYDKDISSFEEIVIGSPIWNGRFAAPINTLLKELDLKNKKVDFLFYAGSGEGKKAQKKVKKKYPNSSYIFLKEPKKYQEELKKISK